MAFSLYTYASQEFYLVVDISYLGDIGYVHGLIGKEHSTQHLQSLVLSSLGNYLA